MNSFKLIATFVLTLTAFTTSAKSPDDQDYEDFMSIMGNNTMDREYALCPKVTCVGVSPVASAGNCITSKSCSVLLVVRPELVSDDSRDVELLFQLYGYQVELKRHEKGIYVASGISRSKGSGPESLIECLVNFKVQNRSTLRNSIKLSAGSRSFPQQATGVKLLEVEYNEKESKVSCSWRRRSVSVVGVKGQETFTFDLIQNKYYVSVARGVLEASSQAEELSGYSSQPLDLYFYGVNMNRSVDVKDPEEKLVRGHSRAEPKTNIALRVGLVLVLCLAVGLFGAMALFLTKRGKKPKDEQTLNNVLPVN